jgi:hypothetical protein
VFFIHSVNPNYRHIFDKYEPYHTDFFDIKCKNEVIFCSYEQEKEITPTFSEEIPVAGPPEETIL